MAHPLPRSEAWGLPGGHGRQASAPPRAARQGIRHPEPRLCLASATRAALALTPYKILGFEGGYRPLRRPQALAERRGAPVLGRRGGAGRERPDVWGEPVGFGGFRLGALTAFPSLAASVPLVLLFPGCPLSCNKCKAKQRSRHAASSTERRSVAHSSWVMGGL